MATLTANTELNVLLCWALLHIGLVYFVTASAIFAPFRILLTRGLKLGNPLIILLYCTGCTGFWLGVLECIGGWGPHVAGGLGEETFIGRTIILGVMGMGVGAIWGAATDYARHAFAGEQITYRGRHEDPADETETETEVQRDQATTRQAPPAGGGRSDAATRVAGRRDDADRRTATSNYDEPHGDEDE